MTFLYEKDTLNKLSNILKNAQVNQSIGDIAKKLVNKLDFEFSDAKSDKTLIGHEHGFEVDYSTLANLKTLLKHAAENGLKFNNIDIINQNGNDPERVEYNINDYALYINKEALSGYLSYLGNQAKQNKDKVLASLVNGLFNESKSIIGKKIKPIEVYYDDEINDSIKVIDANLSFLNKDNNKSAPLTLGDLKSKYTFNAWLQSVVKDVDAAYTNLGNFLNYLKKSFEKQLSRAINDFNNLVYTESSNRVKNLMKEFDIVEKQDKENFNNENVEPSGSNLNVVLSNIISNLPLKRENVDRNRINAFFKELTKFAGYNQFQIRANRYLDAVEELTGLTTYPLTSSYSQVFSSLQNPSPNNFFLYTQNLRGVIDTIYNAIDNLRAKKETILKDQVPGSLDKIAYQIGESAADSSVYKMNSNSLQDLENKFKVNFKKK